SSHVTDPATTDVYTLSLHDALPISTLAQYVGAQDGTGGNVRFENESADSVGIQGCTPEMIYLSQIEVAEGRYIQDVDERSRRARSEEHTSELQSLAYLVCRLLLEKK